jgi:hypothetical protein
MCKCADVQISCTVRSNQVRVFYSALKGGASGQVYFYTAYNLLVSIFSFSKD